MWGFKVDHEKSNHNIMIPQKIDIEKKIKNIEQIREIFKFFLDQIPVFKNVYDIDNEPLFKDDFKDIVSIIEYLVQGLDVFESNLKKDLLELNDKINSSPDYLFEGLHQNLSGMISEQIKKYDEFRDFYIKSSYQEKISSLWMKNQEFKKKVIDSGIEINFTLDGSECYELSLPEDYYNSIISWDDFLKKLLVISVKLFNLNSSIKSFCRIK